MPTSSVSLQSRLLLAAVVCLAIFDAGAFAQSNTRPQAPGTYLVVYRPGPAFVAGKPLGEQPLRGHGRYMLDLYARGALKFAGGFADHTGGAAVFAAESEEAARAIVAADPAVISRVFEAELHPWNLVDWEQRAKQARP